MVARIVLTVDGSARAERAVPVAAWLAGRAGEDGVADDPPEEEGANDRQQGHARSRRR
jgi:nucleotide-binding universal stress UspA family protein